MSHYDFYAYKIVNNTDRHSRALYNYTCEIFDAHWNIRWFPIAAVTPETMYDRGNESFTKINDIERLRITESEFCTICSHYKAARMVEQMAGVASFIPKIIMEHDAMLFQPYSGHPLENQTQLADNIIHFKDRLKMIEGMRVWNPGIAMECYRLNTKARRRWIEYVEKHIFHGVDYIEKSVMYHLHRALNHTIGDQSEYVMWPIKGQRNESCISTDSISAALAGRGVKMRAPVSQLVFTKDDGTGISTIEKSNQWTLTSELNPNMVFIKHPSVN